jgi:hypothetical protein
MPSETWRSPSTVARAPNPPRSSPCGRKTHTSVSLGNSCIDFGCSPRRGRALNSRACCLPTLDDGILADATADRAKLFQLHEEVGHNSLSAEQKPVEMGLQNGLMHRVVNRSGRARAPSLARMVDEHTSGYQSRQGCSRWRQHVPQDYSPLVPPWRLLGPIKSPSLCSRGFSRTAHLLRPPRFREASSAACDQQGIL